MTKKEVNKISDVIMEESSESFCSKNGDNDTGLRLVSIVYNYNGLGMKLCRNSWDPYPFISHVAENSPADLAAVKIGDCILKVNHKDVLGQRIQEIAEEIHKKQDPDNKEVNLLLWRSGSTHGFQPQLLAEMVTNLLNIVQFLECPICMEIAKPPSFTYQCINGHIVCEKCRWKTTRCPICRVQLGKGRCLVADKILHYMSNNIVINSSNISNESQDKVCKTDDKSYLHTSVENPTNVSTINCKSVLSVDSVKHSQFIPFNFIFKKLLFWKQNS